MDLCSIGPWLHHTHVVGLFNKGCIYTRSSLNSASWKRHRYGRGRPQGDLKPHINLICGQYPHSRRGGEVESDRLMTDVKKLNELSDTAVFSFSMLLPYTTVSWGDTGVDVTELRIQSK